MRLSGGFHLLVAELAGSRCLFEVLRDLVSRTSLITAMYGPRAGEDCGPDEHAGIVERIASSDAPGARLAMDHHLHHVEARLDLDDGDDRSADLKDILA